MSEQSETIQLLASWRDGNSDARDHLIAKLYPELALIAAARLRRESDSSLSTGDLINEAVIRLMRVEANGVADRRHLVALASRMMRNILVDHARAKNAGRRAHVRVELTNSVEGGQRFDLHLLDAALIRLGSIEPHFVEIVEMRYFGGMSIDDIAEVTGMSQPTVKRRWQTARAWLMDCLANPIDG